MSTIAFTARKTITAIFVAGFLLTAHLSFAENHHKDVLVIHSYTAGFAWTDDVQRGITESLANYATEGDVVVDVATEFLDAKRFPSDELHPLFAEVLEAKYADRQPDVIISSDDDAMAFLLRYRDELFPDIPVIFCGLNYDEFDSSIFLGITRFAAVVERLDFSSTIDLIAEIHDPVQIAFILDHTTSGRQDLRTIRTLGQNWYPSIEFLFLADENGLSEEELLTQLEVLDPAVPVFFVSFFLSSDGTALPPEYIIPHVTARSNAPVYTHVEHHMGLGLLGGKLLSGEVHGASVGAKAATILESGFPFDAYVTVESSNRYLIDYDQMQRFGLRAAQFPPGTTFLNRPEGLLSQYSEEMTWASIGLVLLVASLILLTLSNVRRRSVERKLEISERKYRAIFEKTKMVQMLVDEPTGIIVNANAEAGTYYGYSPGTMPGKRLDDLAAELTEDQEVCSRFPDESGTSLQRHRDRNASERDVELHYSRLTVDGQPLLYMLINDVTARVVAERALSAALDAKEMLIREMNHRIKNNLAMITALVRLKENSADQVDFDSIVHQIDAIRIVHEQLYEGTTVGTIAMTDYIVRLLQTIFRSFADRPVVLVTDIQELELSAKVAVPVGLIINETATNAIKHGFGDRQEITYSISLEQEPSDSELRLVIENSGEPIPEGVDAGSTVSLGLRLVAALTDQLQGSLTIERSPHPRFTIRFPDPPPEA